MLDAASAAIDAVVAVLVLLLFAGIAFAIQGIVHIRWIDRCLNEMALAFGHTNRIIFDAYASMNDDHFGHTMTLHAFEYIEIACLMMRLRRNGACCIRIPNDNVRIGTDGNATLFRVQIEYLRRIGACDCNKFRRTDDASVHTFLPNNRHTIFDTIHSVRYFGEIIFAQFFVLPIEGAVVAAGRLQMAPTPLKKFMHK